MKKIILRIIIAIIIILGIIIYINKIKYDPFKNFDGTDYRDKNNETITQNKEFLDYTFQTEKWTYKTSTDYWITFPSGPECLATKYLIEYKDKEGKERTLELSSNSDTIEYSVKRTMEEIVQEEIEKMIIGYKEGEVYINTTIAFEDESTVEILNTKNGVKLYNVYEFLENEAKKENLKIEVSLSSMDEGIKNSLDTKKEETKEKLEEYLIEKLNYNKLKLELIIAIRANPGDIIY